MATFRQRAGRMDLEFQRGDDVPTEVDFSPITLEGCTVGASIVSTVTGAEVSAVATTIVDAAAGRVAVHLTKQVTASLPVGTYRWEMSVDRDGNRRTYLTGFVEVLP